MKKIIFWVFLVLYSINLQASELSQNSILLNERLENNADAILLLPVNYLIKPPLTLSFKIPQNYRIAYENPKSLLTEIIPKGEDINNWSNIISYSIYLNGKISADQMINQFINQFKSISVIDNFQIIERNQDVKDGYNMQEVIISYYNIEQKNKEILYTVVASGPVDASMVQYTIRPNKFKNGDFEQSLMAIKKFSKNNIKLIQN